MSLLTFTKGEAKKSIPGLGSAFSVANKIGGALGLGPPQWKTSRTYKYWDENWQRAKAGDKSAHYPLYLLTIKGDLPNSRYTEVLVRARDTMSKLGYPGWSKDSREPGQIPKPYPIKQEYKSWPVASGGPVPGAALASQVGVFLNRVASAPSVSKRAPRPQYTEPEPKRAKIADGPRQRASTASRGFAALPKRACKYGPRGEDGLCPKKPSTYSTRTGSRRMSKTEAAARRRIESGVVKGLTSAGKAAVKAAGGAAALASFAATAALVGAAGVGAFLITRKLMTLRYNTYDDLRKAAADEYRYARAAIRENTGRALTPAEGAQLAQWFKAKMARLDEYQRQGKKISGVANLTFRE